MFLPENANFGPVTFINQNPFLRVLTPFLLGIAAWLLGFTASPQIGFTVGLYALCVLVFLTLIKRSYAFPKLLFGLLSQLFLLMAGWGLCRYHYQKENPQHYSHLLSSEPEFYAGYISDLPAEREKTIKAEVVLQHAKVKDEWQNATGKIIVYLKKSEEARNIETGKQIVFAGQLKEVQPTLNPHEFDYKNYLARKNIYYTAYLIDSSWACTKAAEEFSLYGFAQKVRKHLLKTYRESGLGDNEFALVAALVLGYDDEIDQPLMNAYSHTGTLHVLSVSGLHVGVIYLVLGYLLSFMNRNRKLLWVKVVLILALLWFFVLLSGFSAPAVRAAFMFSLILFGKTLFERVEVSNIVFVAAFLSLCYDPYWLADVGFQLSYLAVLGIIYLYPRFYNMFAFSSGFLEKLWALCSVSIAAQIATLPLTLYYFHQFPLLFLVTNLVLIPVSTVVMGGGILILVFSKVAFISKALVWLTALLVKFMNGAALFFDQLPFCVIDNINLSLVNMILLYTLIILVFVSIEYRSFKLLAGSFALSICMFGISLFFDLEAKKNRQLVIYHADKTAVAGIFEGNNYLQFSDTVPDNRIASTLRENKIRADITRERSIPLSKTCVILAGNKKVLFLKDGSLVSKKLMAAVNPDLVWLPAAAVKRKKQRVNLGDLPNLVITGRTYAKEEWFMSPYFTQNKGAFILSLQ